MKELKKRLRDEARGRRAVLAAQCPDFAERVAAHAQALQIPRGSLVGAYVAMEGEADPHLLLKELAKDDCAFAFPRVAAKKQPLAFHRWPAGSELVTSAFGVPEPAGDWPRAVPSILLVPMLAFDRDGYRLGYGGGFYDITLAALRAAGELRAIGVAFAGQEVEALPREPHDQRLDAIVTEKGLRRFC
ncbi:MAG TPA: 5-formyltetrahydrofolate cyclo-ligase [Rhizomicrobium sp.]|nr:5-formyltetrahydrofolate cyclo-ligase [Rhizomicrobium sp.]